MLKKYLNTILLPGQVKCRSYLEHTYTNDPRTVLIRAEQLIGPMKVPFSIHNPSLIEDLRNFDI